MWEATEWVTRRSWCRPGRGVRDRSARRGSGWTVRSPGGRPVEWGGERGGRQEDGHLVEQRVAERVPVASAGTVARICANTVAVKAPPPTATASQGSSGHGRVLAATLAAVPAITAASSSVAAVSSRARTGGPAAARRDAAGQLPPARAAARRGRAAPPRRAQRHRPLGTHPPGLRSPPTSGKPPRSRSPAASISPADSGGWCAVAPTPGRANRCRAGRGE